MVASRSFGWGVVVAGVVLLCGVALANAGPAGAALAEGSNDTVPNATDGSEPVGEGCPPADAIRKEVYNGLETRSVAEVRSVIPADAVRCLPDDVRDVLGFENETDDSDATGDEGNTSAGDDDGSDEGTTDDDGSDEEAAGDGECPSAERVREEVDGMLEYLPKETVREEIPSDEVDCLPEDVKDRLNVGESGEEGTGDDGGSGADGTDGDSTDETGEGVDCPSEANIRAAVESALAESSPAAVREQIPSDEVDCLPEDVRAKLNVGNGSAASGTGADGTATDRATASAGESDSGTATGTDADPVDCPPVDEIRRDVNRTLDRMSAAQFRTMVPEKDVECFPPDVRERLGLTADAASGGEGSPSSDAGGRDGSRDGATGNASAGRRDSDGDGVPDRYDYAPRDPDVQSKSDVAAAEDPGGGDDGSDERDEGVPVVAGSALLLVLAVGGGAVVYRRYEWPADDGDDGLLQPSGTETDPESGAGDARTDRHDIFGESAFDPGGSAGTDAEFTFDAHDDAGFVFEGEPDDEDAITLEGDDGGDEADAGFVFEDGLDGEPEDAGEPADD